MPDGLLVLDKPSGFTSYDCVRQVKRLLRHERVGHCGSLDPLAQGVLLVVFGRMTRRQEEFLSLEKQYWFRAELGRRTFTGDREGRCLETQSYQGITPKGLKDMAGRFVGDQEQIPPRVAALKYQGKRYYEWSREGVEIPRLPRRIQILSLEILSLEGAFWDARVVCSRGTYIRSLVEDIAKGLGTVATVDALVRERIGPYRREQALPWNRLCACSGDELLKWTVENPCALR